MQSVRLMIVQNKSLNIKILIFSEPEPKAPVSYWDHSPSVVRPASVRLLTFHIFDFSETTAGISTKLDRKQVPKVLSLVC